MLKEPETGHKDNYEKRNGKRRIVSAGRWRRCSQKGALAARGISRTIRKCVCRPMGNRPVRFVEETKRTRMARRIMSTGLWMELFHMKAGQ